jgi:hypothetical protein
MWQIVLRRIPGSEKYVCPFYSELGGCCKVYAYGIIDCDTWPFYLMSKDDRVVIALSPDCETVSGRDRSALRSYALTHVAPLMLEMTSRHPELLVPYRSGLIHLADLGENKLALCRRGT